MREARYIPKYAREAPCRERVPVAMRVVCCWDFSTRAASWVLELGSDGAFQWPNVLWGSDDDLGWMGIISLVSESLMRIGSSGRSSMMRGEPFGLNSNLRAWKEHLLSSSFPPVHQSKSFQV